MTRVCIPQVESIGTTTWCLSGLGISLMHSERSEQRLRSANDQAVW